jgi:hypothetical protein
MKTEKKTAIIFAKAQSGEISIEVTTDKFTASYCSSITNTVSAPISEIEIDVPVLSSDEVNKVLTGSMLSSLIEEREKVKLEMVETMRKLDQRIADLQCLEFKGEK